MSVTVLRDLVCRQVAGYRAQAVDLYMPSSPVAVCVYLHGGGWRMGSRRAGPGPLGPTSGRLFTRMADAGLLVSSTDYRLSGEATFPAQLDDIRAAIAWVRDRPEAAGLPLVLFGVSAGGNMALLCAADTSLDVRAVAAWYPPTDLVALPNELAPNGDASFDRESREALWLGAPAIEVPDIARAASPMHASSLADMPPVLLLHGDVDASIPLVQSEHYHAALVAAGARSTLEVQTGYDHLFTGMPDGNVDALVDRTARFLLSA